LQNKNVEIIEIEDLCNEAVSGSPEIKKLLKDSYIIACSEKAIKAILSYLEIDTNLGIKGILTETPDAISKYIDDEFSEGTSRHETISGSDSWNPFIDKNLCNNCGQCYEFCIFKVYSKDDNGNVLIANPEACKDNCPACARLCPQNAIVFPKHPEPSINGAKDRVDPPANTKKVFENDIYKAIAQRQKRNKIFKDDI
jgi:NAD-dependent dihydropyrimidine dehydrogenase PreA subunit